MAKPVETLLVAYVAATKYDGTNADDIMALFPEVNGMTNGKFRAKKGREDSKTLTIYYDDAGAGPQEFTINVGDYVIRQGAGIPTALTAADVAASYVPLDSVRNLK